MLILDYSARLKLPDTLVIKVISMATSSWIEGLSKVREYYEGFVKNVDDALVNHSTDTVTTYGIWHSRKIGTTPTADKGKP